MGALERLGGAQRAAEFDALRGGQQLDGDDGGGIVGHRAEPPRGVGRHAHMIFLIGRGRQAVDARGMGQGLVLRCQGGGHHLGLHEARVEPRLGHQEGRQLAEMGIVEQGHAALGQGAGLGDGQGQHVGRHGHRLGVEVTAREHLAGCAEHQGIIGDAVGLAQEDVGGEAQVIETGAHDLGLAAQGIGILHPVAIGMGGTDRAARQ